MVHVALDPGFNLTKDSDCLVYLAQILSSTPSALVIEFADHLSTSGGIASFLQHLGLDSAVPIPIYLTISNYHHYRQHIHPLISRIAFFKWFNYPSEEVVQSLVAHYGLDLNKTLRDVGPSFNLLQTYFISDEAAQDECFAIVENLKDYYSTFDKVDEFPSTDYDPIVFSYQQHYPSYNNLVQKQLLYRGPSGLMFANPPC
ncbi:hypothetical protein GEMRC1_003976 [Eukaryota sp. GEM-RC1]